MSTSPIADHPPIYGQLVRELGDVVAESRRVAAQTQAQARAALDFGDVRRASKDRVERAFSAFGEAPGSEPRQAGHNQKESPL